MLDAIYEIMCEYCNDDCRNCDISEDVIYDGEYVRICDLIGILYDGYIM